MTETIQLTSLSYGSAAVGRTANGKVVFVEKGCPEDVVEVEITNETPTYCQGAIVSVLEQSPYRTTPACPYQNQCGGCPWMQVRYTKQLEAKKENVIAQLIKIANIPAEQANQLVEPCKPSKHELGYRNKLEFGCSIDSQQGLQLGFRQEHTSVLFSPDSCLLAARGIEKAPKALRGALRYLQGKRHLDIFRVGIRRSVRTKETEIALWTPPSAFPRKIVADTLSSALSCTSIVRVMAHPGKQRKIKGVEALFGKGCWSENLADFTFRVSAPSFFQVNTHQAERMITAVCDGLNLDKNATVADLYCGAGSFTLPLAKRVKKVYAVEAASSSVQDLRRNLDAANLTNVAVIGGDSARELPRLGQLDALVVDPPRAGLARGVAEDIAQAAPQKLAYISCDPATWARDVKRLQAVGYSLVKALPYDLFPQSYHIETVSFFRKG